MGYVLKCTARANSNAAESVQFFIIKYIVPTIIQANTDSALPVNMIDMLKLRSCIQ